MKKYSIIINHVGEDQYATVFKSWMLSEDGTETDVQTVIKMGLTLQEAIQEQTKFLQ